MNDREQGGAEAKLKRKLRSLKKLEHRLRAEHCRNCKTLKA